MKKHGSLLILVGILIQLRGGAQTPSTEVKETLKKLGAVNQAGPQCTTPEGLQYVCEDMAKLACAPGEYSDGTGTSYSTERVEERNGELRKQARIAYEAKLNTILSNPDVSFNQIRTLAKVATSQNGRPECISKESADQVECHQQVAKILATQFAKSDFIVPGKLNVENFSPLDFQTFDALQNNVIFNQAMEETRKSVYQSVEQKDKSKKIENEIFPRVRSMLIEKIKVFVKDAKTRQMMIDKVNNIAFKGGECGNFEGEGGGKVSQLLVSNAFYDSNFQAFRYCNGLLAENNSEFMLVSVVTHELTHSIDPCLISKPSGVGLSYSKPEDLTQCEKEYPFENIVQCLRTKESIGAERSEWNRGPEAKARFKSYSVEHAKDYIPPPAFCSDDQIGESVSDWMASEILPDYIQKFYPNLSVRQKLIGYSNVYRPFCNKGQLGQGLFKVHPDTERRIHRIFMANRKIRHEIGCVESEKTPVHCQPGKPVKGVSVQVEMEAKAAEDEKNRKNENCPECGTMGKAGYPSGTPAKRKQ